MEHTGPSAPLGATTKCKPDETWRFGTSPNPSEWVNQPVISTQTVFKTPR